MKINRNNYEVYFINYIEGNLDEKLVDDFLEFLQQNPDLKEELLLFQSVSLEPEEIQFNKKEKLYKNKFDLENHFNQASVALLEGDLTNDEKAEFENYLNSHPDKKKEFQLLEKTKLQPDLSIKFSKKNSLYHRPAGRSLIMWSVRIAAVLVLAFTFFVLANRYTNNQLKESQVADVEKKVPQKGTSEETQQQIVAPEKEVQKKEIESENKPTEPKEIKLVQNNTDNQHENFNEPVNEPDIVIERTSVEPLEPISRLSASLEINRSHAALKTIQYTIPEKPVYQDEERYLADVIKEKTGINKLSFNKIAKAGLNIVSGISKEKLTYETDESGKVTEINYDSRLFAFSIPTKNETDK